jgi:excisionase family DNA binding protein
MATGHVLCDLCDFGGVDLSEAIGLADEAAKILREQQRPDMAAAVEMLRLAAEVTAEETFTPSQVARLMGIHRNTVRNWVNQGAMRAVKVGPRGDLRVPKSEAIRWIELDRALEAGIGWPTERQVRAYLAMRQRSNRATRELKR